MKTYKNITVENAVQMEYCDLMSVIIAELEKEGLNSEATSIVADLMIRYDEDVYEDGGQYFTNTTFFDNFYKSGFPL